MAGRHQEERIAVGIAFRHDSRAGGAARAGTAVDDDLLAERLAQMRCNEPCGNVDAAAGDEAVHQADWPYRIVRRLSECIADEGTPDGKHAN